MGNSLPIHVKNKVPRQSVGFHKILHHVFYPYPISLKKIIKKSHFHIHYYTNPFKAFKNQYDTLVYMTVYMNRKVYTLLYTKNSPEDILIIFYRGKCNLLTV